MKQKNPAEEKQGEVENIVLDLRNPSLDAALSQQELTSYFNQKLPSSKRHSVVSQTRVSEHRLKVGDEKYSNSNRSGKAINLVQGSEQKSENQDLSMRVTKKLKAVSNLQVAHIQPLNLSLEDTGSVEGHHRIAVAKSSIGHGTNS